ncbi:MAG TPA: cupin domain-containing protein [Jatrophihabitans sp.]|jgi:mannose-6-phosphate isomerase-like protein (cupin superfamily)|nr:cupin domain-containing protein [Jatrophihabitans sp.]
MRTFDSNSAESATVGPLDIARWEQYDLRDMMPFGAMWYTVPAGGSSLLDCHPERELSIVIEGTAFVECNATVTEVPRGSAILFDSEEPHVIHNRDQDAPLTIFSAYWLPPAGSSEAGSGAAGSSEMETRTSGLESAGV